MSYIEKITFDPSNLASGEKTTITVTYNTDADAELKLESMALKLSKKTIQAPANRTEVTAKITVTLLGDVDPNRRRRVVIHLGGDSFPKYLTVT